MNEIKLPQMDPEVVSKEIGDFVIDTVEKVGATGCVIGLSGGIDSSTTAALIKRAFDDYNARGGDLELVGYILPSGTNEDADTVDGVEFAEWLGVRYEVHDIEKIVDAYRVTNPDAIESKYDRGNLTSRVRANVLSTKAATERKVLAGTGNKDEDFGIGYYTLFGDGAVHMSPIGGLSKRLVRQMAGYLGIKDEMVNREPTAGLEPGQTDFKDLGYSYDLVELVTEGDAQGMDFDEIHNEVAKKARSDRDQYIEQFGKAKFHTSTDLLNDIFQRHYNADAKVDIIHPPGPEITLEYR